MIDDIATVRMARGLAPVVVALLLATACQPPLGAKSDPSPTPTATPAPNHVFVIVLENTSYERALAQPYLGSLASRYAVASNYHAVGRPSLPNYLAITSGSTWGINDDGYHRLPATGIGKQLTAAGITWKAYFEGFTGDCFRSPYPYALKHNPFAYYGGLCPTNVVPMPQLTADLKGDTPQFAWIAPGLCNDAHDCPIRTADNWLSRAVPEITRSAAWQKNGVLFITFDEGNGDDDRVALFVVSPRLHGEITKQLDHYSLLATIEDALHVPRLGLAKQATSLMTELKKGTTA
jgi:phospholipase C